MNICHFKGIDERTPPTLLTIMFAYVNVCVCVYLCVYLCMHTHLQRSINLYMCQCTYINIYFNVYVFLYNVHYRDD